MFEDHRILPWLWFLLLSTFCACSSDADVDADANANADPSTVASSPGITPRPLPGCEGESYAPCDVETEACQAAIFSTVSCLRGDQGAVRPLSRIITVDEFRAELAAEQDSNQTTDEAVLQASEHCLVLLHLAKVGDFTGGGVVEVQTSTVPAYYEAEAKRVTLVHPEGNQGLARSEVSYITLVHEYVHALQDQAHDFARMEDLYETTFDSTMALRALVEGEAVLHEDEFLAATWGLDPTTLDESKRLSTQGELAEESLAEYSPITAISRNFPYSVGGVFVQKAYQRGGMAAVRALFQDVPSSTLEIRTGIKMVPVVADPPMPAEGYSVLQVDTLGAEMFRDFVSASLAASSFGPSAFAADWRGDRVYFYDKIGTEYVTVVWRIKLASESLRTQLLAPGKTWMSRLIDGDVVLAMTTDPEAAAILPVFLENAAQGKTATAANPSSGSSSAAARRLLEPKRRRLSTHGSAVAF